MKASFSLIPAESRRLIAKAVVEMDEVKLAMEKAYIVINGGTTNGYIAQELAGVDVRPEEFHGRNRHTSFDVCHGTATEKANTISDYFIPRGKVGENHS